MEIHDPECGCAITPTYDWGNLSYVITFCPLHAAAPALLENLQVLVALIDGWPGAKAKAEAAITKAEGG